MDHGNAGHRQETGNRHRSSRRAQLMHFRFVPSARRAGPTGAPPQHEWRSSGKRRAISKYKKLLSIFLAEDPQSLWQGVVCPNSTAIDLAPCVFRLVRKPMRIEGSFYYVN